MYSLLAVVLGLGLSVYFSSFLPVVLLGLLALSLVALAYWQRVSGAIYLARIAVCLCLGALTGYWQTQQAIDAQLPKAQDGQTFDLTIKIASLPEQKTRSISFEAKVIDVADQTAHAFLMGKRVKLSWYRAKHQIVPGQTWQLSAKLRRPRGFVNLDSFDYQAWLLGQGIAATGYVKSTHPVLLDNSPSINTLRMNISSQLESQNLGLAEPFFKALLVGDKSGIHAQQWSVLQRTGTIHLMAISGLHIGLLAFWGLLIGKVIARVFAAVNEAYAGYVWHVLPLALSTSFALFYAALAGFTIPTQRALLACIAVNMGLFAGIKVKPLQTLLLIAMAVLLLQPFAFLDQGFCLSFAAVAVLLFCLSGRSLSGSHVLFKSQWVLFVGLCLPLVLLGQAASGVSGLANLVAVPCISILIVPGLMISAVLQALNLVSLSQQLVWLLSQCFEVLWWILEALSALPNLQWWPSQAPGGAVLALALFGVAIVLLPGGLHLRLLGIIVLAALLLPHAQEKQGEKVLVTVMDVGQGLAIVVDTGTATWLYDTGPKYSDDFDAGSRILAPFLRKQGVKNVSVIAGHGDMDHNGGMAGLMLNLQVDQVFYGEHLADLNLPKDPQQSNNLAQVEPCETGQVWHSGQVKFEMLWPPKDHNYDGNNASCVVLITVKTEKGPWRMLVPGDIERSVENLILSALPDGIDVLVSPHHGSRSSSGLEFLQRLQPKTVVVSAGFKNRYGHPHPIVLERYEQIGAKVLNTADQGAVIFTLDNSGSLQISSAREKLRRRWFD